MNEKLTFQAYYTKSDPILSYMTDMLNLQPQDSIFEPCGGDGVFVDKILEKSSSSNITIYELNPKAVELLRKKYEKQSNIFIKETDTLLDKELLTCSRLFDKIIGNPPYGARIDEEKKKLLKRLYSDIYTKESYTLFLYACTRCLRENGELSFIIPDTFLSLHRHIAIRKYLLTNTKIRELALFPSSFFPGVNFGYANLCIITLEKTSDLQQNLSNDITIRTGINSVEDLEKREKGITRIVSQKEVYEGIGAAFMLNSTKQLTWLINNETLEKIGNIANCVTGFYSGNDKRYLHPLDGSSKNAKKYTCVKTEDVRYSELSEKEKIWGIETHQCFVPIMKGGNVQYVKPNQWFMDWSVQALREYRNSKKCRFQNSSYYFKKGIGIPMIRSSRLTSALLEERLFDQSIVGVFPNDETYTYYLLGFFNSAICSELINVINPSTNNSANYIKKIPFIQPSKDVRTRVENTVKIIIATLKQGKTDIDPYQKELDDIFNNLYMNEMRCVEHDVKAEKKQYKQLNFLDVFQHYPGSIVENSVASESLSEYGLIHDIVNINNVLICNVKLDNIEQFLDQSAKIYYTGKKFPSTVALNKLYYFMPYIKSKGIRDLYLIRVARVGTRKEGQPDNNPDDLRLVFEIEFVKQLFNDYKPIRLEIWRTYTDTTLSQLISTIG